MTGSFQVRFWDIKKLTDTNRGRHRVRWSVAGREHHRSFATKALADGFLSQLKTAAREGRPFDQTTGRPGQGAGEKAGRSWYEHARGYAELKWPQLAAKSRRAIAEALTTLTIALTDCRNGAPDEAILRRALLGWAFNPTTRTTNPPEDIRAALEWTAAASLPVSALTDPAIVRQALDACTRTQVSAPAAAATVRRKRAVFHNALGYAVEAGLLSTNPVARVQWRAPAVAETVDRRVVANPTQVAALLTAVRAQGRRGQHLEAFFGCLYYAAMRPCEAVALRETDCVLPDHGWGRLDLTRSEPRAGRAWTDTGTARDPRGLKHRAHKETRSVPIPPVLVQLLREHIDQHGTSPDGRLFRTARGNPLQDSGYGHVWRTARTAALTPAQAASPLARRPYDLRHAAVSLWLTSGVPATDVARRAGHGVAVLLTVYANCIDGHADNANHRIDDALGRPEDRP